MLVDMAPVALLPKAMAIAARRHISEAVSTSSYKNGWVDSMQEQTTVRNLQDRSLNWLRVVNVFRLQVLPAGPTCRGFGRQGEPQRSCKLLEAIAEKVCR